jgi:SAM-dependent methyltransferase
MPQQTWNNVFGRADMHWEDPDWHVVGMVPLLHSIDTKRVLDLGCGAGRHVIFLAREGFEVVGQDVSDIALHLARKGLHRSAMQAELFEHDMEGLPYPDGSFDSVISVLALYHNRLEGLQKSIAEVHRVLRPGGYFLVWLISRKEYDTEIHLPGAEEIEPYTLTKGGDVPDAGIPHHFSDEDEVRNVLLYEFDMLCLEESMEPKRPVHWIALTRKP